MIARSDLHMGRPYEMPDPDNVTPANPKTVVEINQTLGLYNQEHREAQMQNLTDKVKEWFKDQAIKAGWNHAEFVENICILERTDLPTIKRY